MESGKVGGLVGDHAAATCASMCNKQGLRGNLDAWDDIEMVGVGQGQGHFLIE